MRRLHGEWATHAHGHAPRSSLVSRRDPFRGGDNLLVMCDCHIPPQVDKDGKVLTEIVAHPGNTRAPAAAIMEQAKEQVGGRCSDAAGARRRPRGLG